MKTLSQKEIQKNILKIIELVKNGEDIVIKGEQNQEKVAVIIPFKKYKEKDYRTLGILKGKASYKLKDDFEITDEELLAI